MTIEVDLTAELRITARLDALRRAIRAGRETYIGFPGATDIDYSEVMPFFGTLLNNVGDPWTDPGGTAHTKAFEREVLDWFADLFDAPQGDRWGYLTSGGTEGNLYGLYLARSRFPDALVYFSAAAHYSLPKCVDLLGIPSIMVRADERGEIEYNDLAGLVAQHRHRPAIVVANAGTTMTEAVDDVVRIKNILRSLAVRAHHVHADAALSGIPLALLPNNPARLSLSSTIDTIAVSGHKFLGTPIPCGFVLSRRSLQHRIEHPVAYTDTLDTTISGSRCGQVALLFWYAIQRYGLDGLRARAQQARALADYATRRLNEVGCPAWRHPYGLVVNFPTPDAAVTSRWVLASSEGSTHLICMPGITMSQVDRFVADIAGSRRRGDKTAEPAAALPPAQLDQRYPRSAPVG